MTCMSNLRNTSKIQVRKYQDRIFCCSFFVRALKLLSESKKSIMTHFDFFDQMVIRAKNDHGRRNARSTQWTKKGREPDTLKIE